MQPSTNKTTVAFLVSSRNHHALFGFRNSSDRLPTLDNSQLIGLGLVIQFKGYIQSL